MCLLVGQGSISGGLQISCIQHTTLYPVSCRALSFSQFQPWVSIPVAPVENLQLFEVKYSKKKKVACRARLSVELNMHPNRSFCGSYARSFACFASCHVSLLFPCWGEGTVTFGVFPQGCEDTVARRWLLFKGGGVTPPEHGYSAMQLHVFNWQLAAGACGGFGRLVVLRLIP